MSAVISNCGKYRYLLERETGLPGKHIVTFIMLNPSTADAETDDATIRKCVRFAKQQGAATLQVINLFAFRATNPKDLRTVADPFGPDNESHQNYALQRSGLTICAWGVHGTYGSADIKMKARLKKQKTYALALTKDGHPKHPLYVSYATNLVPFTEGRDQ